MNYTWRYFKDRERQKEIIWLTKLIIATITIMLIGGCLIERFAT